MKKKYSEKVSGSERKKIKKVYSKKWHSIFIIFCYETAFPSGHVLYILHTKLMTYSISTWLKYWGCEEILELFQRSLWLVVDFKLRLNTDHSAKLRNGEVNEGRCPSCCHLALFFCHGNVLSILEGLEVVGWVPKIRRRRISTVILFDLRPKHL